MVFEQILAVIVPCWSSSVHVTVRLGKTELEPAKIFEDLK